jgi:hypothetical protein
MRAASHLRPCLRVSFRAQRSTVYQRLSSLVFDRQNGSRVVFDLIYP